MTRSNGNQLGLPKGEPFVQAIVGHLLAGKASAEVRRVVEELLDHTLNHPWVDDEARESMEENIRRQFGIEALPAPAGTENPGQRAEYVGSIEVQAPGCAGPAELEVWLDPSSGALFALDAAFLDQIRDRVASPYNPGVTLRLTEDRVEEGVGRIRPEEGK